MCIRDRDQVIIAEDEDDLCYMLRKLDEECQKWSLTINTNKTEYTVIGNTWKDILLEQRVVKESNHINTLVL